MMSAEGSPAGIKLIDAYVAHYITAATEGIGSKALSRIVGNIALEPILCASCQSNPRVLQQNIAP